MPNSHQNSSRQFHQACFFTPHPLAKHHNHSKNSSHKSQSHSQANLPPSASKPSQSSQSQSQSQSQAQSTSKSSHSQSSSKSQADRTSLLNPVVPSLTTGPTRKIYHKSPPKKLVSNTILKRKNLCSSSSSSSASKTKSKNHVSIDQINRDLELERHDSSSLSSLFSDEEEEEDDDDVESSSDSKESEVIIPENPKGIESNQIGISGGESITREPISILKKPSTISQSDDLPPQSSPNNLNNKMEIDDLHSDLPSELGEDVCLEYTDFGQDLGFPVTWSESEYDDDDHEVEEPVDEFAEFLLMDQASEEGEESFGFTQLGSARYTQMIGIERSEGGESSTDDDNDDSSQLGYMIIEEFEPMMDDSDQDMTEDSGSDDDDDDDHSMSGGDDGATTDSLDEDDHSGLVRFGIEAADDSNIDPHSDDHLLHQAEEDEDARFFDLPPASALGSMLTNFDLSVISTPDLINNNNLKNLSDSNAIKLPIMGTFPADREDGTNAGRTIIDSEQILPLSPFTGGKVVRYNRFRKLRQRSCTGGESERSSIGGGGTTTPRAEESNDSIAPNGGSSSNLIVEGESGGGGNGDAEETEFDITAFIRGISSIDEGCSDGEKNETNTIELDGLSRWQRVPMTAFRRRTMMMSYDHHQPDLNSSDSNQQMFIEGAIQPSSSFREIFSGLSRSNNHKSKKSRKKLGSSSSSFTHNLTGILSPKIYDRRDHRRRLRKTTSYNSNGKQSKLDQDDQDQDQQQQQLLLEPSPIDLQASSSSSLINIGSAHEIHQSSGSDGFHSRLFEELLVDLNQSSDLINPDPHQSTTTTIATSSSSSNLLIPTPSSSSNPSSSSSLSIVNSSIPNLDHSNTILNFSTDLNNHLQFGNQIGAGSSSGTTNLNSIDHDLIIPNPILNFNI
ncbi:hypothetical protein PSTG_13683 [Puccinia striiformis f. sp. tritici PST-78]|uniref:Uncharacterized protein n=1 Tax=Puccinia striiformis f. sp. tritici PST-78 TaxID=1165861 RepID=A0A0L0V141_9BASI|nr:hypothetical protein PSTG_13683 [Puccinia striiformis f. sp. tritici PST-78]